MLDKPPSEREWLSWLYVGLTSFLIFLTVPFARAAQSFVAQHIGRDFFLYIVGIAAIASIYAATANLKKRQLGPGAYLWLFGVGSSFAIYTYSLRSNPEEAIHFVEYGVLSVLVYRALVHRVRDYSVFVTATIIVGTVGIIDEWMQWITPSRVWDLRDIQINVVAGGLTQVAIAAGLRPSIVVASQNPISLSILCRAAALGLLVFGLTLVNTPERVARYATNVPALSFLLENKNVMVEYGYLYRDPEIGIFRSRFTIEQLAENDRLRGAGVAKVMDKYINEENFSAFQVKYSVTRDAYAHETGIHLFRRNRYLSRARSEEPDRANKYNIAFQENRILEKYFPAALYQSTHRWSEDLRAQVELAAYNEEEYESRVSAGLITRFSEKQVLAGLTLAVIGSLLLAAYYGRRKESPSARSMVNED